MSTDAERGGGAADTVRALFAAYLAQDAAAADALVGPDLVFTSPQDDHIDRATWFAQCFPTASRLTWQELRRVAAVPDTDDVFVMYEYELLDGTRHRNAELITVRAGLVQEVQVFFGSGS